MIEYINLKNMYISTIQTGLMLHGGYEGATRVNDILHKFCEQCVDNSNYSEADKRRMKLDLEIVKEALSQEIEHYFI